MITRIFAAVSFVALPAHGATIESLVADMSLINYELKKLHLERGMK
jgi:hypothetical protein